MRIGDTSATAERTGDGALQLRCALPEGAAGELPVLASAPATATSAAIPETRIGAVTVSDRASILSGDLAAKLGADWTYLALAPGAWLAARGDGWTVDGEGNQTALAGEALDIATGWTAKAAPTGYLSRIGLSPFGVKAAQPVPAKRELKAEAALSQSKKLARYRFTAQQTARLEPGLYQFAVEASGMPRLTLATIQVTAPGADPVTWTIPQTLRVSVGQQYQLVEPLATGAALPELKVKTSNKQVATLTAGGVLTAKKAGTATISVRDAAGGTLKCKLTVVSNRYSRSKPLYIKGKPGLYTSTKRLYYEKGKLKAEVFVANTTGATVKNPDGFIFELYDGEQLVYQNPVGPLKFALKHRKYGVYKLTVTNEMLPGVRTKAFDLGSKRYQAVIRGDNAIPLVSATVGAVQAKPGALGSAGTLKPASTNP